MSRSMHLGRDDVYKIHAWKIMTRFVYIVATAEKLSSVVVVGNALILISLIRV